jgi:hypothetical protein
MHKTRNAATQIDQCVQLYRSLASTKSRPGKQAQAKVDGRRVQRINGLLEFHAQGFGSVQLSRFANQNLREVGIDPPVVRAVRVGQGAARNLPPKACVIQLRLQRAQAGFDVPQAFAIGQLGEGQTQKLIATRESARPPLTAVLVDARIELAAREKIHELGKHKLAAKHKPSSAGKRLTCQGPSVVRVSSRVQTWMGVTACNPRTYRAPAVR